MNPVVLRSLPGGNVVLRQKVDLVIDGRRTNRISTHGPMGRRNREDEPVWSGDVSPNPILTTLEKFPEVYSDRLHKRDGDLLSSFDSMQR